MSNESLAEVGVIIGRFQCPFLHDGHKDVINQVRANHPRVLVFVGVSYCKATKKNPMDYITRKRMIEEAYPDVEVLPINDVGDDHKWSSNLDTFISMMVGPRQKVILYGGRDSFINHYFGIHKCVELIPNKIVSASEIREQLSIKSLNSQDFRTGIVWTTQNRYDSVVACVDVVPYNPATKKFLIIRKPEDKDFRFIGGHSEVKSLSYEEDGIREVEEETGVKVYNLKYIGSSLIDDPRWRGEDDKIKSIFYIADYVDGEAVAKDDVAGGLVSWFSYEKVIDPSLFVGEHKPLVHMLREWIKNNPLT